MLLKMSALADMSPVGDKKSSRTFQRNFSEEKFLSEGPQSDRNRHEGPSLCMPLGGIQLHSSCVLRSQVGAPPRHPASLREGLTQALFLGCASKFYVNITRVGRSCIPTIGMQASRQCPPQVRLGECQLILSLRIRPRLRHGRTSSVACRRHLPLEGKASVRI